MKFPINAHVAIIDYGTNIALVISRDSTCECAQWVAGMQRPDVLQPRQDLEVWKAQTEEFGGEVDKVHHDRLCKCVRAQLKMLGIKEEELRDHISFTEKMVEIAVRMVTLDMLKAANQDVEYAAEVFLEMICRFNYEALVEALGEFSREEHTDLIRSANVDFILDSFLEKVKAFEEFVQKVCDEMEHRYKLITTLGELPIWIRQRLQDDFIRGSKTDFVAWNISEMLQGD